MKPASLLLAGLCLASCTSGSALSKLDAYSASEMGYTQLDKCLLSSFDLYMNVTVDLELISDMAATRCMTIARTQADIIRYSKGDNWTKQQLAAPFRSHRDVQMRAFSIYANIVRDAKSKKAKIKP